MFCSLVLFGLLASVHGRAVNISNTWVLPEEGFPVFYRYFRDRISWYEADAVCQFHHANLVTVDTTAQYDAVRAYLKELDISSAVWVGLIRSNPDGDFTWTDYRGLSSDGYWSSAPDSRSAPLCAATNPIADYRWEARACGGPTVASFICELPVPQWALGSEGCMVKALPALTILYLPESAAVQLTADCGLAGVKRVQCTGNVKRENLLKDLACVEDEEPTTVFSISSTGISWSATTDQTFTDQDITTEITTQEPLTTEHEVDINEPNLITTTIGQGQEQIFKLTSNVNRNMLMNKNVDLSDNNAQSNFIPKNVNDENILTDDQLEKLEDERHMQHKMLHEEIARVGNVDNIFNQPTDHFIPPLVMAKAKISDDMTVLSLAEKHAQQLAEKQFSRRYEEIDRIHNHSGFDKVGSDNLNSEKPLITSIKSDKLKDVKKDFKTNIPKKYVNDKYYDTKTKPAKVTESKTVEKDETTGESTSTESIHVDFQTSTSTITPTRRIIKDPLDEENMDLTVLLKDANLNSEEHTTFANYTGDIVKLDSIVKSSNLSEPIILSNGNNSEMNSTSDSDSKITEDVTMDHEVIKITIIDDDSTDNAKVFEVTTKVPIFKDGTTDKALLTSTFVPEVHIEPIHTTETHLIVEESTTLTTAEVKVQNITDSETISTTVGTINPLTEHTSTVYMKSPESTMTTVEQTKVESTTNKVTEISTLMSTYNNHDVENINNATANITTEQGSNFTEIHDDFDSNDSHGRNDTDSEEDFQSPLLSGANEPVHRPPRTRRPQQPNRNKFNPFRILG